jgi:hypothetical protein
MFESGAANIPNNHPPGMSIIELDVTTLICSLDSLAMTLSECLAMQKYQAALPIDLLKQVFRCQVLKISTQLTQTE